MKMSNKIILGVVLSPLVIATALQAALYVKYKGGGYTYMKTVTEDDYLRPALGMIDNVSVYGVENFNIIPSDTLRLEIRKEKYGHLHYTMDGKTLVIHGDTTFTRPNGKSDSERSYTEVNIYLPSGKNIVADNTNVSLNGSKDSLKAMSYDFKLLNNAGFKTEGNDNGSPAQYFKSITIDAANASQVELSSNTIIENLSVTMLASSFTDNVAQIGVFNMDVDKRSSVTLKGENLRKMNAMKK